MSESVAWGLFWSVVVVAIGRGVIWMLIDARVADVEVAAAELEPGDQLVPYFGRSYWLGDAGPIVVHSGNLRECRELIAAGIWRVADPDDLVHEARAE